MGSYEIETSGNLLRLLPLPAPRPLGFLGSHIRFFYSDGDVSAVIRTVQPFSLLEFLLAVTPPGADCT